MRIHIAVCFDRFRFNALKQIRRGISRKALLRCCEEVDKAELIGIERAKELFGAEHANLQPHSGASANVAVTKLSQSQ